MGHCRYQFNPSELYQRTKPGTAPEVTCGARTFPVADEPELACVRSGFGSDGAVYEYRPTGRHVARATDDPYCPGHGGSPEPPPPPVSPEELEWTRQHYLALLGQYQAQQTAALPAGAPAAAAYPLPATGTVTEAQVAAAAQHYTELTAAAGQGEVTSG